MFSIYHKENGVFKFRGIMLNRKSDKFVNGGLMSLKWNAVDVKLFSYEDNLKFHDFLKHYLSPKKDEVLYAKEDGTLEMCKITKEFFEYYGTVEIDSPYVLDYYTQDEVDHKIANEQARIDFHTLEANAGLEFPIGDLPFPEVEEYIGMVVKQKEEREIIDSIMGVAVDIDAKIAEETTPEEV